MRGKKLKNCGRDDDDDEKVACEQAPSEVGKKFGERRDSEFFPTSLGACSQATFSSSRVAWMAPLLFTSDSISGLSI